MRCPKPFVADVPDNKAVFVPVAPALLCSPVNNDIPVLIAVPDCLNVISGMELIFHATDIPPFTA